MLSDLVGGYIAVRVNTNYERMISGMLSPSSWAKRISLIDNLKTFRFSCDVIESLVTCTEINGHRLYHGHATRPNLLTTIITVNGASFSKDMSQRSVVIRVRRPMTSGTWDHEAKAFIELYRDVIAADVRWHLEQPASPMTILDRWPLWCTEVLSRQPDASSLLLAIGERREVIDEDDQDATEVIEYIRACLHELLRNVDLDKMRVLAPPHEFVGVVEVGDFGFRYKIAALKDGRPCCGLAWLATTYK